jgi:hypothetical protein
MWISASALSYSKCPESNEPTTVNCFRRGTTPAGVTCPCGAISVTFSPSATPSARASSPPSMIPNSPSASAVSGAPRTRFPTSDTCGSASGTTPRISTPRTVSPRVSNACALTYGAASDDLRMPLGGRGHGLPVVQRAVDRKHLDVRDDRQHAVAHLRHEAVHHRQHHDQRHHAERDAQHRDARDERNEAVTPTRTPSGARVAQADA